MKALLANFFTFLFKAHSFENKNGRKHFKGVEMAFGILEGASSCLSDIHVKETTQGISAVTAKMIPFNLSWILGSP